MQRTAVIALALAAGAGCAPRDRRTPSIAGFNVYYGDLHNHSGASDGAGLPADAYRIAKNVSALDFFSLSDHSFDLTDSSWSSVKEAADLYNEDGVFATLWGFEWTSWDYGHVNVFMTDDFCDVDGATATFDGLAAWLDARDTVAFMNHPGWPEESPNQFGHWAGAVSDRFVGLELRNEHDGFERYYYGPGFYPRDDRGFFDEALVRGWKLGAAGFDDNHRSDWGMMNSYTFGVLSKALTRSEVVDALRSRRFFISADDNAAVSFSADGNEMGSTIPPGNVSLRVQARDGDDEKFVRVIIYDRNRASVLDLVVETAEVDDSQQLTVFSGDYFYAKVTQADGDEVVSSPIWVGNP